MLVMDDFLIGDFLIFSYDFLGDSVMVISFVIFVVVG